MRTFTSTELRNELAEIVTCQDDGGEDEEEEEEEEDPEEEREDEEQEEDKEEGKVDKYYLGSFAQPSWPAVAAIRNLSNGPRGKNSRLCSRICGLIGVNLTQSIRKESLS
jgi:hypothetical protein